MVRATLDMPIGLVRNGQAKPTKIYQSKPLRLVATELRAAGLLQARPLELYVRIMIQEQQILDGLSGTAVLLLLKVILRQLRFLQVHKGGIVLLSTQTH